MVRVRIPATSANLGAGFDSLGLAVNLYNYVDMGESDGVFISSTDGTWVPTTKENLIYQSAQRLYDECGKKLCGLRIIQQNNIPMTRGLGSSSACIVGGLAAANQMLGNPLGLDDMVGLASDIEGHPDNTTPALLGGIVTAVLEEGKVFWVKQEVHSALRLIAVIPDFKLSTEMARQVLPEKVSHMDARYNLSRAALFSASLLQGKYENIRIAVEDRLHQPYRMKLIHHAQEVFARAYALGAYGVYISGAGPTMMAIVDGGDAGFVSSLRSYLGELQLDGWKIEELSIDNDGTKVETIS